MTEPDDLTLDSVRDVRLFQRKKGVRFGTDALLLADFAATAGPDARRIADLGTGTGILALLLARRLPGSCIDAVEVQKGLADLAVRNVALNGLTRQIRVVEEDICRLEKVLADGSADLVVANPPYRPARSGHLSPYPERTVARHEVRLAFPDLAGAAARLLKNGGRLCLIHLPERMPELLSVLSEKGLGPKRLRMVHPLADSPARFLLLEAEKGGRSVLRVESPLHLRHAEGRPSAEFALICGETKTGFPRSRPDSEGG